MSKRVVLISGLPCAGKTTYARNHYSDLTIYDDIDSIDVIDFTLDEFVLVDYNLTLRENLEIAKTFFEENGYEVEHVYIDTPKDLCLERAESIQRNVKVDIIVMAALKSLEL